MKERLSDTSAIVARGIRSSGHTAQERLPPDGMRLIPSSAFGGKSRAVTGGEMCAGVKAAIDGD